MKQVVLKKYDLENRGMSKNRLSSEFSPCRESGASNNGDDLISTYSSTSRKLSFEIIAGVNQVVLVTKYKIYCRAM